MIKFREELRVQINNILMPSVGVGSDPAEYIKTWDKRLKDVEIAQLPCLVINVRMNEKLLPGEIGNRFNKYTWTTHIYYLDMEVNPNSYDIADQRRDHIIGRIEKTLEESRFLQILPNGGALRTVDTDGHQEVVYDSSIQAITFDESGEDGHQTFVSEIYHETYTDRF